MSADKPAWDVSISGRHPALKSLAITPDEIEQARANNERLQAELAELRSGVGTGLSEENKWITHQEQLAKSFAGQLAHWQDKSIQVGEKSFACPIGHEGTEWDAIQAFTLDTAIGRIESRHGDLACPQCGSDNLTWTSTNERSERIKDARKGLANALYRLSRFDEAAVAITNGSRALPGFGSLLAYIKAVAEAVHKPDGRCPDTADYQEWDKIYSSLHGHVLPVLRCPECGDLQIMLDVDTLQPTQAKLRH